MDSKVKQIMADVLKLDPASIGRTTALGQAANWDSLRHVDLCLALEQEFDVTLEVEDLESMLSYDDILRVLQSKVGGAAG